MTLSPAWLDELRARTTLSAVIAPSVKLIKAGREFKACCPFHQEKTPSFTVNDEKGFYHCFGCGAHGDAIRFLTDARGLPVHGRGQGTGRQGRHGGPRPRPARPRTAENGRPGSMTSWPPPRNGSPSSSTASRAARPAPISTNRGIDAKIIERFGLGFAPDSRGKLKAALKDLGEDKLVESGMLIQPEEGEKASYDRFRGRIMFPIRDQRGRVIAFGGRILGRRRAQISQFPRHAALRQGPHPLQHRPRRPGLAARPNG